MGKRLSIDEMRNFAKKRGGRCISKRYVNSKTFLTWECAEGHRWKATAGSVKGGTWCPKCKYDSQRLSPLDARKRLQELKQIAKSKGGKCLSTEYLGVSTRLKWQCAEGHVFSATPAKVKIGRWCRECGNRRAAETRRTPMARLRELARERGGECLSKSYEPTEKQTWKCEKGHVWRAAWNSVSAGHWCPSCGHGQGGRKQLTIEQMRKIAARRGGECLSKRYTNWDTKLRWRCKDGHVWEARPGAVKRGSWCPTCAGKTPLTIKDAKRLARSRGGTCLSSEYSANHRRLEWRCANGHTWKATYANISWGRWCPECSSGQGERICRAFFEQMFRAKFPKVRPPWLINSDGHQMELDGCSEELGLAFEHQGAQHYRHVEMYHDQKNTFLKRQRDDRRKKRLCKRNGIVLLEIPEIPNLLALDDVQAFIVRQCKRRGFKPPKDAGGIPVDLRKAYSPSARERLKLIRDAALAKGGKCLSPRYLGTRAHYRFRCAEGHEWESWPQVILNGHWCPQCASRDRGLARRMTIETMQEIASSRGGKCLSKTYRNANSPLLWECAKGHQWMAIPNSVKRGSWCLQCSGRARLTIEEMRNIAATRGGKCLSKRYVNNQTALRWRCEQGHDWRARPADIKQGRWCPKCAIKKRRK